MIELDFTKETFGTPIKNESVYMYRDIGSKMLFKNTLVNLCNLAIKFKESQ